MLLNENEDHQSDWEKVSTSLVSQLGVETCESWFCGASLKVNGRDCELALESDTHLLWVETNFIPEIELALSTVFEDGINLSLAHQAIEPNEVDETVANKKKTKKKVAAEPQDLSVIIKRAGLNIEKGFDNFVVGSNSQFAHAACHAISTGLIRGYNPLFVHCPPGLGKTHLLQALGQEILKKDPKKKVCYLTGEKFTNKYIEAVRKGTTDAFRKRYRKVDMLILDDVQFLVGKGKSQEEFFHTFNTLLESQCQVVLTSDRPASEIQTFDARLSSRFEAGLTVSIAQPDFETRVAILQSMLRTMKVKVSTRAGRSRSGIDS